MLEYTVEITRPTELDLNGICTYIADTLKEPRTARRIYTSLKQEIMTLATLPERHPVIDEPPYAQLGIRQLLVANYVVFYVADQKNRKVAVLRILYNRREWRNIF